MPNACLPKTCVGMSLVLSHTTRLAHLSTHRSTANAIQDNMANQLMISMISEGEMKIAIIDYCDLDGNTGTLGDFSKYIPEELIIRLLKTGRCEVVERRMLQKVIEEHKLTLTDEFDRNSVMELTLYSTNYTNQISRSGIQALSMGT